MVNIYFKVNEISVDELQANFGTTYEFERNLRIVIHYFKREV